MGVGVLLAVAPAAWAAHVYVANTVSSDISAFTIGAGGALSPVAGSPFGTDGPAEVAVTPNAGTLYAASYGPDEVSGFAIGAGGALTPIAGSPFATGTDPIVVAVTQDGTHL